MTETPLWELSKENAAPLERGRNVEILERSVITDAEDLKERERMIRHYERLIRPTESTADSTPSNDKIETDDDPLIHWLSYIKFYQEVFPADTNNQFLLLERCFRSLCRWTKYSDDQRFIRVCCMYAEKTNRAREIFQYMYSQKIGIGVAIFWAAWAFICEKEQDFAFAEKVFEKGIGKKAQPIKYLLQRQKQFQRRMSRHWLNSTKSHDEGDNHDDESASRAVLTGLSASSLKRNDRARLHRPSNETASSTATTIPTFSVRSRGNQSKMTGSNTTMKGFSIFVEDTDATDGHFPLDNSLLAHQDRVLEREQDRRKENTLQTERWNDRGALLSTASISVPKPRLTAPVAFAVYVDESCAAKHKKENEERLHLSEAHRGVRDERTFRERKDAGMAEILSTDPLRFVRNPNQVKPDQAASAPPSHFVAKTLTSIGYNSSLLRSAGGQEQSFEEARVTSGYFKVLTNTGNLNCFRCTEEDSSYMSVEASVSMNESRQSIATKSINPTPRNASTASSVLDESNAVGLPGTKEEQTINTALALKELSMMFSSPAFVSTAKKERMPILHSSEVESSSRQSTLCPSSMGNHDVIADLASYCNPDESFALSSKNDMANPDIREPLRFKIYDETVVSPRKGMDYQKDDPVPTDGESGTTSKINIIMPHEGNKGQGTGATSTIAGKSKSSFISFTASKPARPMFQIFEDASDSSPDEKISPTGDTASLTLINEAFGHPKQPNDDDNSKEKSSPADGDTASLTMIGDAFGSLIVKSSLQGSEMEYGSYDCEQSTLKRLRRESPPVLAQQNRRPRVIGDGNDENEPSIQDYNSCHAQDIELSLKRVIASAARCIPRSTSLAAVLRDYRTSCHLDSHTLPRPLKRLHNIEDVEIKLDQCSGRVKQELGRGAYGVVVLLDGDGQDDIAVKVQSPSGCLGHEYDILRKVEERVQYNNSSGRQKFPCALSFISFADGALLAMTAASLSGFTLIDLVNLYSAHGENIPEIIAIYYTAKMLDHIEMLHWKAKVLHCDVKPDNWVLSEFDLFGQQKLYGAGLMLIDFGRAVDLTSFENRQGNQESSLCTLFSGLACPADMMPVSMRKGLPWSFDIDTFGVCASAHVLLFRSHMQVEEGKGGRWMPKEKLRRYHQSEIWTELFDTLLNLDDVTKSAIGSRPFSLRQLRNRFESYLSDRREILVTALKHQSRLILSSK